MKKDLLRLPPDSIFSCAKKHKGAPPIRFQSCKRSFQWNVITMLNPEALKPSALLSPKWDGVTNPGDGVCVRWPVCVETLMKLSEILRLTGSTFLSSCPPFHLYVTQIHRNKRQATIEKSFFNLCFFFTALNHRFNLWNMSEGREEIKIHGCRNKMTENLSWISHWFFRNFRQQ